MCVCWGWGGGGGVNANTSSPSLLPRPTTPHPPTQMVPMLPMTYRYSYPLSCGGSWQHMRYRGFFTQNPKHWPLK